MSRGGSGAEPSGRFEAAGSLTPSVAGVVGRDQRADLALVEAGLFQSRARAGQAISAGLVRADGSRVAKPSVRLRSGMRLEAAEPYPYVSRGGVKLAAALDKFAIDPAGLTCLDVGASTGGFTDVLLHRGAARVLAADVGHGQFAPQLASDPRVRSIEGVDARALAGVVGAERFDVIVVDVSFISLRLVLPAILPLGTGAGQLVALVKPQFEVGPSLVRKGIVREPEARQRACADVCACVEAHGYRVRGVMPSPIEGGDGNVEFLLHAGAA